jgi:hypothetical protein
MGNRSFDACKKARKSSHLLQNSAHSLLALGLLGERPGLEQWTALPPIEEFRFHRRGLVDTAPARRMRTVGTGLVARTETSEGPLYELHSVGIE